MAGSGLQEHINIMFAGNAVRHYVDWQGHLQSSSWPHVDTPVDAAFNTNLVAKAYHIPLPTKETY